MPEDTAHKSLRTLHAAQRAELENFKPRTLIGADNFRELVEESNVIVDKTMLIKEFMHNPDKVNLITYPRRWGKTINMSMLKTFFELEVDKDGNELPPNEKINPDIFAAGNKMSGKPEPLDIWHEKEIVENYFGRHPVIYITLKDIRGGSYEEILSGIKNQILVLYASHRYLGKYLTEENSSLAIAVKQKLSRYFSGEINLDDIKTSLRFLSELLFIHFNKKPFILIDEYDSPINYANLRFRDEDERLNVVELFRGILGGALKENPYLQKALVTGIMRIAKADLFSGVNNFREYGILTREYSRCYGFTQKEIEQLLLLYRAPEDLALQIKDWYNGYNFNGIEIYNPWSILQCLAALRYRLENTEQTHEKMRTEILQSYWEESGSVDFIHDLLKHPQIKAKFSALVEGVPIYFNLKKQITVRDFNVLRNLTVTGEHIDVKGPTTDLLFSYLFLAGYLTPTENNHEYRLPNKEIRHEFGNKLLEYYEELYNVDPGLFYAVTKQIQLLLSNKEAVKVPEIAAEFTAELQVLMRRFPQFAQIKESDLTAGDAPESQTVHGNEDLVHSIFTYIILQVKTASVLASEMYLGKGRADLVLIDNVNRKAAILELKYNRSASEALEQIKSQEYAKKLQEKFTCILIGINISSSRDVEVEWEM